MQAALNTASTPEFLDARGMHAALLAATLEDLSTSQHTAAACHVQPDLYAAVRPLLPGVTYHAGLILFLLAQPVRWCGVKHADPGTQAAPCTKLRHPVAANTTAIYNSHDSSSPWRSLRLLPHRASGLEGQPPASSYSPVSEHRRLPSPKSAFIASQVCTPAGAQMLMFKSQEPGPGPAPLPGAIAIVSSASADDQSAEQCKLAAKLMGCYSYRVNDLSTGAIASLFAATQRLQTASVLVVCAGRDAALPGVLAGLVQVPVIALPGLARTPFDADPVRTVLSSVVPGAPSSAASLACLDRMEAATVCKLLAAANKTVAQSSVDRARARDSARDK